MNTDFYQIIIRLIVASIIGGIIGFEREIKGRDAGIRTHTLVALGACIITLSQIEISRWVIEFTLSDSSHANIISSDITRLTAQIINGIGFLGAGTILISKNNVLGLTTAASIWVVASLGISIGMGYFYIAIPSLIIVLIVLNLIKRIFKPGIIKQIYIEYDNFNDTSKFISETFELYNISLLSTDFSFEYKGDNQLNVSVFTITLSDITLLPVLLKEIGAYDSVSRISTISNLFD